MTRARRDLVIALVVLSALVLLALAALRSIGGGSSVRGPLAGPRVGLVEITGPIIDAREWVQQIDEMRRNDKAAALVVRIDSPGGAVGASEELYRAVARAREAKPVVVSMGNVAASGGYYAALGADSIVANASTTTGSIGVIMQLVHYYELMEKLGLDASTVKSGRFKDSGSPFRELTEPERQYFRNYIDDAYHQFVDVIVKERPLDRAQVLEVADGRIFTGSRAQELGLVDHLGDQFAAVGMAGRMGGIEGEPKLLRPPRDPRQRWIELLLDGAASRINGSLPNQQPPFLYMWRPESTR